MNLQILDCNNFFKIFINSDNILKTSIDIKLDCLKSKNILKKLIYSVKIQLRSNLYEFTNSRI